MIHDCITYEGAINSYKIALFCRLIYERRASNISFEMVKPEIRDILFCHGIEPKIRESTRKEIESIFIACGFTDNDHDGIYWK